MKSNCIYSDGNIEKNSYLENMLDITNICVTSCDTVRSKLNEDTNIKESENTNNYSSVEDCVMGVKLCKILLDLYELVTLKNIDSSSLTLKRKTMVVNALTEILCISKCAKQYALEAALPKLLIQQLTNVQTKLSLESIECLKRIVDRKRVCPVLSEMENLIALVTNFMVQSYDVKYALSILGLTDILHKLWVWCIVQKSHLINTLRLLCTFSTDCIPGKY